jgi:hypothetical protein
MSASRYLTKSRFTLALECPTKLFYTGKPREYANRLADDEFMAALAEGGFQVGELAKLMHPGGIEVIAAGNAEALAQTTELLKRDTVTLYEATIAHGPFLVRVDILNKVGTAVELIEVKAKSFSSKDPFAFKGKRGGWDGAMLPYLQDVAFQRFVLGLAHPEWQIQSFLMMADKDKVCSVTGLNQRFRIQRQPGSLQRVIVQAGTTPESIGEPILTAANVDAYVDELLAAPLKAPGIEGPFGDVAQSWARHYRDDRKVEPVIGAHCGRCEFRSTTGDPLASGFHECWRDARGWSREQVDAGTVLDIWNFRKKQALIDRGILSQGDVKQEDLGYKESGDGLTHSQRQWMQVSGRWPGGGGFFMDRALMRAEMTTWTFPLHFIDFETARVATPFYAGQRPYANIAFQFSHHRVDRDGTVTHAHQYLSLERGVSPNYEFARQFKAAVGPAGTVFMWTSHENTTLLAILAELEDDPDPPADAHELVVFLKDITREKDGSAVVREGSRAMYDLCDLARRAFFHPATKGSSSIKRVLPAVLSSSQHLRERYGRPVYGAACGMASLNFTDQQWWRNTSDGPANPYDLLPPVFDDVPKELLDRLEGDEEMQIAQGGAATTAWARIQFEEVNSLEQAKISAALLRYCELDTLAMVMIYEAWKHWLDSPAVSGPDSAT